MDIYAIIEFYIKDQIIMQRLIQQKESYEDIELRMGKRISKNLKNEIDTMISRLVKEIQIIVQRSISYKGTIAAHIKTYSEIEKKEIFSLLQKRIKNLEEPIAITEYELNKMALVGKYQEYVDMCCNVILKPSMIPEEYRQKVIELKGLQTRKTTYEELLELLRQYKQNTPMKP